ncbi:MAG TPA: hypothetical protein VGD91_09250 [Trebonia sp.]
MPPGGSHATVTGGLATGGLAYAAETDRHQAIGAGQIGAEPFRDLLAMLPEVPFVVETPGGKSGHARDIATLKELRGR